MFYIKSKQTNQEKDWYIEKLDQNGLKYRWFLMPMWLKSPQGLVNNSFYETKTWENSQND